MTDADRAIDPEAPLPVWVAAAADRAQRLYANDELGPEVATWDEDDVCPTCGRHNRHERHNRSLHAAPPLWPDPALSTLAPPF